MIRLLKVSRLLLLFLAATGCQRHEYSSGQGVFQGKCVKCHLLNGTGGTKGPDLSDIFQKKDESYIRNFTQDPRSLKPDGTMPPSELTERELDLVIEYMKEKGRARS